MTVRTFFIDLLIAFDERLDVLIVNIVEQYSFPLLLTLVAASYVYGFLHSAGPGHGKTIVSSLFLKEKHPLRKALLVSGIVAAVHSGSAVILALLFSFILTGIRGMFHIELQGYFTLASGILILTIGVVFLLVRIKHRSRHHHHFHLHHHEESDTAPESGAGRDRNIYLIGLTAGMVPCPAALVIMLLTISNRAVSVGIISVVAMSLGVFSLLTLVGLVTIRARTGLLHLAEKRLHKGETVSTILEFASSVFIILIGSTIVARFLV